MNTGTKEENKTKEKNVEWGVDILFFIRRGAVDIFGPGKVSLSEAQVGVGSRRKGRLERGCSRHRGPREGVCLPEGWQGCLEESEQGQNIRK